MKAGGAGESGGGAGPACWFCARGRHAECMREVPVHGRSDGPHDCSFDTALVPCICCGEGGGGGGHRPESAPGPRRC